MCRAITCKRCGKPGWKGCGAHVEQVLGHVPQKDRCHCDDRPRTAPTPPAQPKRSWFRR